MPQIVGAQTVIGSTTGILAARRVVEMDDSIHELEPSKTPLMVLLGKLKTGEETANPQYSWLEGIQAPKVVTSDGTGIADGSTTSWSLASGDGSKVSKYDLIKNPATGEILLVTAVSTDALTVVRAFGTTAGAALAASQVCLIIGNANRENDTRRDMLATSETQKTNYAQIFRTPFGFSDVAKKSNLYGGKYAKQQMKKKGIEHEVEMERQFLFGEPKEQSNSNGGRWATGGVDYWVTSNRYDTGGSLDYGTILDFCQQVFRYGNQSTRLFIAAPIILSALDNLAAARLFTEVGATVFGVRINRIQTSHGELAVVKHPLLSETGVYNERGWALDMDTLKDRVFTGRNTKLRMNIEAPSTDGEEHEYLTHKGLQLNNQEASGMLYNVTSY